MSRAAGGTLGGLSAPRVAPRSVQMRQLQRAAVTTRPGRTSRHPVTFYPSSASPTFIYLPLYLNDSLLTQYESVDI